MKHLFAGALALTLLVAGAASAQTNQPRPDQPGGYHQDARDHRDGDHMSDRGRDHQGRRACSWRHHHRVCRWYH